MPGPRKGQGSQRLTGALFRRLNRTLQLSEPTAAPGGLGRSNTGTCGVLIVMHYLWAALLPDWDICAGTLASEGVDALS